MIERLLEHSSYAPLIAASQAAAAAVSAADARPAVSAAEPEVVLKSTTKDPYRASRVPGVARKATGTSWILLDNERVSYDRADVEAAAAEGQELVDAAALRLTEAEAAQTQAVEQLKAASSALGELLGEREPRAGDKRSAGGAAAASGSEEADPEAVADPEAEAVVEAKAVLEAAETAKLEAEESVWCAQRDLFKIMLDIGMKENGKLALTIALEGLKTIEEYDALVAIDLFDQMPCEAEGKGVEDMTPAEVKATLLQMDESGDGDIHSLRE